MSENIKKNLLKVREMTIEDAEETAQIEAENFSKPWKQKDFEDAVRSKNTLYMVIENQDEIIGYAGMRARLQMCQSKSPAGDKEPERILWKSF